MYANNLDDAFSIFASSTTEEWVKSDKYMDYPEYHDEDYTYIEGRTIGDITAQVSVQGESYSQYISFVIDRYYDGIDLIDMSIWIHYELKDGSGSESSPVNVYYNDNNIRFGWIIPEQATQQSGQIKIGVWVNGTAPNAKTYLLKTEQKIYQIQPGPTPGSGIVPPEQTWFEKFVMQMDNKVTDAKNYANQAQTSKNAAVDSALDSAQSAAASANALEDNKAYVESQKETFIGYNRRETDLKYANALIGSASGTGRVSVGDSWEAPIPSLEIAGKSEQGADPSPEYPQPIISTGTVSTGANLLPYPYADKTVTRNGITFTDNGDGTVTINGTSTDTADFNFNGSTKVPLKSGIIKSLYSYPEKLYEAWCQYDIYNNGGDTYLGAAQGGNTVQSDDMMYLGPARLRIAKGVTLNNVTIRSMICPGSYHGAWEPYTGGKPSPSPEYPQTMDVTVTGENLIDFDDWKKCPVQQGTGAWENGRVTLVAGNTGDCFTNYRADKGYISKIYVKPNTTYTLSWECEGDNGDVYIFLNGLVGNNGHVSNSNKKLTFITNEDTEYITFRVGVREAGETASYWNLMLNKGANPQPWQPYQSRTATISLSEPLRGIGDVRDRIMCRDGVWGIERAINQIDDTGTVPISEALEVLATPIWEPLPSATQSALDAITTYTGTTHVTVTAGGPEPDVGLGYVQDTNIIIAELKKMIEGTRNVKPELSPAYS